MKPFNLTEWALKHKQFIYFFMVVMFIGGAYSYLNLGRMEDPDFTLRQMIVSVAWPGASARQVEEQVTDKIEKKLQDTPGLDYVKSFSTPGKSIIYVALKDDDVPSTQVRPTWLEVRNMVLDIRGTLPQGVIGPFFNDRFDDVFGCIYALTGDGFTYEDLREKAEKIRRTLLVIPDVKKVEGGTAREDLYRNRERQTGQTEYRSGRHHERRPDPERHEPLGHGGNLFGQCSPAGDRHVRKYRTPAYLASAGSRPDLPDGRHRHHQEKLCRPS